MSRAIVEKQLGNFEEKKQYDNLNTVGPDSIGSFRGRHNFYLSGATGLVATQFGLGGMVTVARLATGIYGVTFPKVKDVDIQANIHCPTGVAYTTTVRGVSGAVQIVGNSGVAEIGIYQPKQSIAGTTGVASPTGYNEPVNAQTGTYVSLWFDVMPKSQLVPY